MRIDISFDLTKFLITLVVIVVTDAVYFYTLGSSIYPDGMSLSIPHAAVAYLVIAFGLSSFRPGTGVSPAQVGALFGFIVYGAFNSVEMAIRSDWRGPVAAIDWLYGTCLCSLASWVTSKYD